ncbi:MAG: hypothetical protein IJ608_10500 [Lachnospiraceae bacterium]|nr:hypothetical protein [Lachnospiraceae bacterium]
MKASRLFKKGIATVLAAGIMVFAMSVTAFAAYPGKYGDWCGLGNVDFVNNIYYDGQGTSARVDDEFRISSNADLAGCVYAPIAYITTTAALRRASGLPESRYVLPKVDIGTGEAAKASIDAIAASMGCEVKSYFSVTGEIYEGNGAPIGEYIYTLSAPVSFVYEIPTDIGIDRRNSDVALIRVNKNSCEVLYDKDSSAYSVTVSAGELSSAYGVIAAPKGTFSKNK